MGPKGAKGFQLWIALPAASERDETQSIYLSPESVRKEGPVRVLLGTHGATASAIPPPSPLNYLFVQLRSGERWRYEPPQGHKVGWVAVGSGNMHASDPLRPGDLALYETSEKAIEVEALSDVEFILGSAVPHPHELSLGL